jgi:hypothetical protein
MFGFFVGATNGRPYKRISAESKTNTKKYFLKINIWRLIDMAKRSRWLDIQRKKHGFIWWLLIGWWERPIATFSWFLLACIFGFKGVKFHYYK